MNPKRKVVQIRAPENIKFGSYPANGSIRFCEYVCVAVYICLSAYGKFKRMCTHQSECESIAIYPHITYRLSVMEEE